MVVEWVQELDRWMSVWGDDGGPNKYLVTNPRMYLPRGEEAP